MSVTRKPTDTHHDTRMLNESIAIKELCSHGADIWAQSMRDHLA